MSFEDVNQLNTTTDEVIRLRFAEWRPQTLSVDVTLEIPSIIHHISESDLNPLDFHCWIEISSLTQKNKKKINMRLPSKIKPKIFLKICIICFLKNNNFASFAPLR